MVGIYRHESGCTRYRFAVHIRRGQHPCRLGQAGEADRVGTDRVWIVSLKEAYVRIVRTARRFAERSGLLSRLENSEKRSFQWLRSQFGIYDSADLVHLDVPWWTYSAIDEVKSFLAALRGEASIYEYGSGSPSGARRSIPSSTTFRLRRP